MGSRPEVGEAVPGAPAHGVPALEALSEITASLASEGDLEDLLDRFLGTMIRLSGAKAGAVRVITADGQHLRLVGARGFPPEALKQRCHMDVECGVCADAIRRDSVACSSDMARCLEPAGAQLITDRSSRIVPVPLRFAGRLLGVYNLYLPADRVLTDDVALLFQAVGEHLGMALENARLNRENMRVKLMDERQMMAAEIHDSLAQTLAYMKMRMTLLEESVVDGDCELSFRYMNEVNEALASAYSSLRDLLTQFRNRMDPHGLLPALEGLAETFRKRAGIALTLDNRAHDLRLTPEQEVQLFHIAQEALANIQKHARARRVSVTLDEEAGRCRLTVTDDGVGMETVESPPQHFGLTIMRERAQRLGGFISYASRPGEGTTVRLSFPVTPAAQGTRA